MPKNNKSKPRTIKNLEKFLKNTKLCKAIGTMKQSLNF